MLPDFSLHFKYKKNIIMSQQYETTETSIYHNEINAVMK